MLLPGDRADLPGADRGKRARTTGEQQTRCHARTKEVDAGKKEIGIMPLTQEGRARRGVATTAEDNNGISLRNLKSAAALPGRLKPAPKALANKPQGETPQQPGGGDKKTAPADN